MKKIVSITIVFLSLTNIMAQKDKRLKGIEKDINEVIAETKVPGLSVAIIENDKVIYTSGFGFRDYENKIPVDANTLFAIGSTSKAFTSSILGILREEGKLTFDDSPLDHIPGFRFYNDEMNSAINIQDLMSHRTGLAGHDASWYMFPTHDKDEMVKRVAHHEPATGVRQKWIYNNFMFLVQGVIAEKITGKSWEENIKERIFNPLGMNRSNSVIDGLKNSENVAFGYKLDAKQQVAKVDYYDVAGMGPAGSINSSANDMAKWLSIWINDGQYDGKEILPLTYVQEAIKPHAATTLPINLFPGISNIHLFTYGYGWMMSSYKGFYHVEHNGAIDGFTSHVSFFPDAKIAISVLTNQDGSLSPTYIRNILADRMLDVEKTDWIANLKGMNAKLKEAAEMGKTPVDKKEGTKPSHALADFTGKYAHPGYGSFEITLDKDSLIADLPLMKLFLKHHHFDVFEPINITDGKNESLSPFFFNFSTNEAGEISGLNLKLEPTLDAINLKRSPFTLKMGKEELQRFVGEYDLLGTLLTVRLKNDERLTLTIPGQPELDLIATDEFRFSIKNLEGYRVEFLPSGNPKVVNELKLIQPNGTFQAKRK